MAAAVLPALSSSQHMRVDKELAHEDTFQLGGVDDGWPDLDDDEMLVDEADENHNVDLDATTPQHAAVEEKGSQPETERLSTATETLPVEFDGDTVPPVTSTTTYITLAEVDSDASFADPALSTPTYVGGAIQLPSILLTKAPETRPVLDNEEAHSIVIPDDTSDTSDDILLDNDDADATIAVHTILTPPKVVRFPSMDTVTAEIPLLPAPDMDDSDEGDIGHFGEEDEDDEPVSPAPGEIERPPAPTPPLDDDDDEEEDADYDGDDMEEDGDYAWNEDAAENGSSDYMVLSRQSEDRNLARINDLEAENISLRAALSSMRQENTAMRSQLGKVSTQLASTEQQLLVVSADLATSRSFVSTEDADGAQLLRAFTDLLESVDDHIYLLLDDVGDAPEELKLSLAAARACTDSKELRGVRDFVYASLAHGSELQVFVPTFVQVVLVDILKQKIFDSFIPGMGPEHSALLHAAYKDVCAQEPQDRAARWRAIAYARLGGERDDDALVSSISALFFTALESTLAALLPDSDEATIAGLRTKFVSGNTKLVRDALRLRDLCMKVYLSVDYELLFPAIGGQLIPSQVKIEDTLKRCPHSLGMDAEGEGDVCVAVLSPGLTASKNRQRPGGKEGDIERTTNVLRKPGVVVAKCKWALSHPVA